MKIEDLNLQTYLCTWQIKRTERLALERQFLNFTGHIDGIELHVPYTQWEASAYKMVKETQKRKGKKILVSGGDSLNLDMISAFYQKNGSVTTPSEELDMIIKFLTYCQTVYDHIVFIETNHEKRVTKFLYNNIKDHNQAQAMAKNAKTLKEHFEQNKLNKLVYVNNYFVQIGDAVYSHFENNSAVPGSVDRAVVQYLTPRLEKPWSVCFQFHTHTQSKISIDRKTVIEPGASIDSLDYWRSGKMSGKGKMSSFGYCVMDMANGKADINTCDYKLCGWEGFL